MFEILIILGLLVINGVFSMAEIALVSSRKARLEVQANRGDHRARRALDLASKPETFLSTVQIGITLISILTGIFSGDHVKGDVVAFLNRFDSLRNYSNGLGTAITVIIITYFTLVIGELVPKRIGMSNPEGIAKMLAGTMRIISRITYPFIWLLTKSSSGILAIFGVRTNDNYVTEDEIKAVINEGTQQGTIQEAEQEIIERVFHLSDRNITSLMTHRSDIVWLNQSLTVGQAREAAGDTAHSVYAICDGSIDQIKGVVFLKDLFVAPADTPLKSLQQPAVYVPENNSAYQLLEKFKEKKNYYAFIVDEYGTLQGLITLHDILDAIVGGVGDEEEEPQIVKRADGSYLVDGQITFYNFLMHFERTEWLDPEQEFDTLAGFILHRLERIPVAGDQLSWRSFRFEIVDMDGHRIDKVLVGIKEHKMEHDEQ